MPGKGNRLIAAYYRTNYKFLHNYATLLHKNAPQSYLRRVFMRYLRHICAPITYLTQFNINPLKGSDPCKKLRNGTVYNKRTIDRARRFTLVHNDKIIAFKKVY